MRAAVEGCLADGSYAAFVGLTYVLDFVLLSRSSWTLVGGMMQYVDVAVVGIAPERQQHLKFVI